MGAPKLEKVNPLLDKRFVNAFIEGVVKTISMTAGTDVQTEKPIIEKEFRCKGEVAGVVGMVCGELRGTLSIAFSKESIFTILECMLGEKHTEITPAVTDAVGEITNQIYGSAKTSLNQMGYNFEMAIPSIIHGAFTISKFHNGATLVVPFTLDNGTQFYVDITVM
jgi:chemotaxis protein CheX